MKNIEEKEVEEVKEWRVAGGLKDRNINNFLIFK